MVKRLRIQNYLEKWSGTKGHRSNTQGFLCPFNGKDCPWASHVPECNGRIGGTEALSQYRRSSWVPLRHIGRTQIYWTECDVSKHPAGAGCYHYKAIPLLVFERSLWLGDSKWAGKKPNIRPIFKKGKKEDLGIYRNVSLTVVSGKIMEQILLEAMFRHMKSKNMIGIYQGQIIVFCDDPSGSVDGERMVDAVYLDFRKVFDVIC